MKYKLKNISGTHAATFRQNLSGYLDPQWFQRKTGFYICNVFQCRHLFSLRVEQNKLERLFLSRKGHEPTLRKKQRWVLHQTGLKKPCEGRTLQPILVSTVTKKKSFLALLLGTNNSNFLNFFLKKISSKYETLQCSHHYKLLLSYLL